MVANATRRHDMTKEELIEALGVTFDKIVRYDVQPEPVYWIRYEGRSFRIGYRRNDITQQAKFRDRIYFMTGHLIPRFTRDKWKNIANAIIENTEVAEECEPEKKCMTVSNYDGPATSDCCSIENAGYAPTGKGY
jgi:hypothetical protein